MRILWMGPARSRVLVTDDEVRVEMGWAFRSIVPRTSVRSVARRDRTVWSRGVHGWRGRWLVNGAGDGLVVIEIDPPSRATIGPVGIRPHELTVSVDDPDALVAALTE